MSDQQKTDLQSWLSLALLALIWGSSFILIKKSLLGFRYEQVGALRIFLSMLVMIPILLVSRKPLPKDKLLPIIGVGLFGSGIPPFLFAIAQTEISSGLTGILNALTPLFTLVLGYFFFKSGISRNKIAGVVLGLIGAITIIGLGSGNTGGGDMRYAGFIILATMCYATSVNIIHRYLKGIHPITITAYSFLFVGIPALIFFLINDPWSKIQFSPDKWLSIFSILTLSVIGTAFANLVFFRLTQRTNAIFASTVTYLIPIVALLWGMLDGEYIGWIHLIGMLLILAGVYLAGKNKS